jgi:hypothetical protein
MQEARSSILLGSTFIFAKVAELVYALVSKTSHFTVVRVRFPPLAFFSLPFIVNHHHYYS